MFWLAGCFLLPLELLGAAIKRVLEEATRRMAALALHHRPKLRLAFRAIHAAKRHLVHAEFARGFGQNRFDDGNALHAARCALRAARWRIGHHRNCALAHGHWLIEQRDDACSRNSIALRIVRAAVAHREHIEGQDSAILGKAHLYAAFNAGACAANAVLFFAANAHHHRRAQLLRQQRGNDHRQAAGDLAAESATGVLADEDNVVFADVHPFRNRGLGLEGALRAGMKKELSILPVSHGGAGLQALMAHVGRDERFVENERGILEA